MTVFVLYVPGIMCLAARELKWNEFWARKNWAIAAQNAEEWANEHERISPGYWEPVLKKITMVRREEAGDG